MIRAADEQVPAGGPPAGEQQEARTPPVPVPVVAVKRREIRFGAIIAPTLRPCCMGQDGGREEKGSPPASG